MPPTYLFVIESFGAGGAERSLLEILPRLAEEGVRPVVACVHRRGVGFEEEALEAGLDLRFLDGGSRWAKIRALRKIVDDEQPSLVYTSLFEADLIGRLATIGRRVPVMVNLANTAYDPARLADPGVRAWRLRLVQLVDRVLARWKTAHFHAVSEAVKDSTIRTLGVPPDKITVVRRGRELDRIGVRTQHRRTAVRRALGVGEDAELVVAVGRLEYQKGHVHLVEAFAEVVRVRPDAQLLIVGRDGHAGARVRDTISRQGMEGVVTLLGHRSDVTDIVAAADLFTFPSLYEGLGGALIEAIALGLPAVVSDVPALREVVEEGESADLVAPGDAHGLAAAIVALLADADRLERYGQRSAEIFRERFRSVDANRRLADLLLRVADSRATVAE